jgi:hypothetical protein
MNAYLSFAAQPNWDAQTLAGAVPVRLRLHQLFAYDARRGGASANGEPTPRTPRTPWRQHGYARVAELPLLFTIH